MRIFVEMPTGKKIMMENICRKFTVLVSYYNVQNGSTLKLTVRDDSSGVEIFVKNLSGKTIALVVKPTGTIRDLKAEIQHNVGIKPENQRFTLQYSETLHTIFGIPSPRRLYQFILDQRFLSEDVLFLIIGIISLVEKVFNPFTALAPLRI
ncbi:Ubiquitin-related domain,Ubiquitin domain [Cinara cedri]|uniref:Ubiquitin-related domain,Ubiquitin domain n=1 Tax=Cinara cedri TaxID=506608 RepID=A0A5E4N171_9HEMI|nr:Ubiquitin-related domain,Ubiquitin domain [Cinara cedri]